MPSVVELFTLKNNRMMPQMGILIQTDRNQCVSVLTDGHVLNHTLNAIRFIFTSTDQILQDIDAKPYEPPGLSSKTRRKLENLPLLLGAIKELVASNDLKNDYISALPLQLSRSSYNIDDLTREFQKIKSDTYSKSKWATYQAVLKSEHLFRIYQYPFTGLEIQVFSKEEADFYSEIINNQDLVLRFLERVATRTNNAKSEFDQKLIKVLKLGAEASRMFPDINKTIAQDVLKKSGIYSSKESDLVVFLKDSGLVAPWESFPRKYTNLKRISNVELMEEESVTSEFQEAHVNKFTKDIDSGTSRTLVTNSQGFKDKYPWLSPDFLPKGEINDLQIKDGCENLRKDFGNMPVDGTLAQEIDDGFSIERRSDGDWLHIHIADPTAYLSVNHPLSLFAQMRHATIYFPDRHLPIIPHNLTQHILNLGTSPFAITFSAKFQSNGHISDYTIQPSILKNFKHISYANTGCILKGDDVKSVFSKDLKDIKRLMDKHLEYRSNQGALSTELVGEINLDPYPFTDNAKSWISHTINYPKIQLNNDDADYNAKMMVSECMIVAGRVGARFLSEHKIPALYRRQEAPNLSTKELHDFEQISSKKDAKTAILPTVESRNIIPYLLQATIDTKPGIHFAMGLDKAGYVKLTSPLRRYSDLMIHWNLKAFWSKTKYPFSESDLTMIIPRNAIIEKEIKQLSKYVDRYWLFEWIRRRQVLHNHPEILKENAFLPHETELGIPRSWKWSRESNESLSEHPLYDAFILKIDKDRKYMKVAIPSLLNYTRRCYYRILSKEFSVGNKIKVCIKSVDPGTLDLSLDYIPNKS